MDISTILTKKYPNAVWSISNDDYSTLIWHSEISKPTLAEIQAHIPTIEAEIAAELEAKKIAEETARLKREALLARLGITEEEARLLLG